MKHALIFVAACASAPAPAPVAPSPPPAPAPAPTPVATAPDDASCGPDRAAFELCAQQISAPEQSSGAPRPSNDGKPHVNLGHVTVDAGIGEVIVRRVISGAMAKLKDCYDQELQREPSLEGVVDVAFAIAQSGAPHDAHVSGVSPDVSGCVQRSFEAMQFPPPKSEAHVSLMLRYSTR